MFVFYKYKLGSTIIDGQRIYGYMEKHPPARVTWGVYRINHGSLIQASYTPERLRTLFPHSEFPNISFLYSDLRYLTCEQLRTLFKAFGLVGNFTNAKRRKVLREFLKENC